MGDVETLVRDELDRLLPLPDEIGSDWNAVLRRLDEPSRRPSRRRHIGVVALAALVAVAVAGVTPVRSAVARGVGDFSAWLAGVPGDPVSEEEQRRFEEANERSWGRFPDGPRLRRLITSRAAGATFDLLGFRTGESLCLRLVARGVDGPPATSCAPLRELRSASAPALVLLTDHSFGESEPPKDALPGAYAAPAALATFGIVADGVDGILLHADDGDHRAVIDANAFLYVGSHPEPGTRVRRVSALTDEGSRVSVPIAQAPYGFDAGFAPLGKAYGPGRVERRVSAGSIGWIERRELRGAALPDTLSDFSILDRFEFARVLTPDPTSHMRMVVAIGQPPGHRRGATDKHICVFLIGDGGAGGGCDPNPEDPFPRGPVKVGVSVSGGGNQYATVSGLAADEVARIDLFLATRERVAVPLRDNVFLVQAARTNFPVRLVAYDENARIISVETIDSALGERGPRAVPGKQRVRLVVEGPRGAKAVLRVGPSTDGGRCWSINYSDGSGGGGCPPKSYRGPVLDAALQPAGRDVFVEVEVREEVALVVIEPVDGPAIRLRPVDGFVIHPLETDAGEVFVTVRALNAEGRELAKRGVRITR
jgi:hypothetical protein